MRALAMWATNSKRGLIPGTIGITITVTEYNPGTKTYHAVSSTAFRPAGVPLPATAYRRLESAPVSLVRPFVLAALTEREPCRDARHRCSTGESDER
jgi:hypothetical protein